MSKRMRNIYFYTMVGIFVLLIPFIILYANGYRLGSDFEVVETGGIYVTVPQAGAEIYIDDVFRRRTGNFQKELFVQNLEPKSQHTVRVERPGFSTWYKEIGIDAQEVTALYPFLLPETYAFRSVMRVVQGELNDEYLDLVELFEEEEDVLALNSDNVERTSMTMEDIETLLRRNNSRIWHDENGVYAGWVSRDGWIPRYFCEEGECQKELLVASPSEEVITLDYYPRRDDVIIYSTKTGVYVAEIDVRTLQMKRKIYSGIDVDVRVDNDRTIVIRDGAQLFELEV